MGKTNRAGWLEKIIGKEKADELRDDLKEATQKLDGAGVQRKQADEGQAMVETPPEQDAGDAVQAAAAKLAQQIVDAVSGDLTQLTPELLQQAIAAALESVPADTGSEPAQDGGDQMDQQQMDANKALSRAQQEAIADMAKDMGEMAQAYVEVVKNYKEIAPLVAEIVEWKADIEKRLGQRPRQASQSDETALEGMGAAEEAVKAINAAAQKGTNGSKKVLGVSVKDE